MNRNDLPGTLYLPGKQKTVGVLLVHGFTGTTNEMRPLANHLNRKGWPVHVPLLKGHGSTPEDMCETGWLDWFATVLDGYKKLKQEGTDNIIVVGLSMGGLLALKLAQHRDVLGIATLCSPLRVRDRRLFLSRYVKTFLPYLKRRRQKAPHIEQHLYTYDKTPVACFASLHHLMQNVAMSISVVRQPILIIQSEKDETVSPISARLIAESVGSRDREVVMFKASSHIITLDVEQDLLHRTVSAFVDRLATAETVT